MNRTGTKLASYLIAKSFNLHNIFLEPFTWDKGINANLSDNWKPQQTLRQRSPIAQKEHERLKIISNKSESSPWLNNLFNEQSWEVIKFIEIGRHDLYYKYNENAFFISLIREPVDFLKSINGMAPARNAVIEQWQRLQNEEGYCDPLPDANSYLDHELADCARAYFILYNQLQTFSPKNGMTLNYKELTSKTPPLRPVAQYLNSTLTSLTTIPLLGSSTKKTLKTSEINYINEKLMPVYERFLN